MWQAIVVKRLEERKIARGTTRSADTELKDLAERGRTAMERYRDGMSDAR